MKLTRLCLGAAASLTACLLLGGSPSEAHDPPASKWRVSCFAYRDVNRNGLYDMADRPYAGLEVALIRPDGSRTRSFSNISGFANFEMGFGNFDKMQIYEAGEHTFEAYPPTGFETTSDARAQTIEFVQHDRAGGGMVAKSNCVPMGLAPKLFVAGTVSQKDLGADIVAELVPAAGKPVALKLDDKGIFFQHAGPGNYTARFADKSSGKILERPLELSEHPVVLSVISSLDQPQAKQGPAKTVTFDDLTVSDTLYEIPSGYGGLFWWQWIATHHKFYNGYGYINGTSSGEFIAYNSSGQPGFMWTENGETFDFVGANINVAWPEGQEERVHIKAWRGDQLVHHDTLFLRTTGSLYFAAGYRGITKLEFTRPNSERIVIDDFSFRK
ncbi:MAG: hypothetical protein AAF441_03310 [Pseudomonadota bacterium]